MSATKLDALLRSWRILFRRREERKALVQALCRRPPIPTEADLDLLAELAGDDDERPVRLADQLASGRWRQLVRDERERRAAHEEGEKIRDMEEVDLAQRLVCLIMGDGKTANEAAELLGLQVPEARALVTEWGPRFGHSRQRVARSLER